MPVTPCIRNMRVGPTSIANGLHAFFGFGRRVRRACGGLNARSHWSPRPATRRLTTQPAAPFPCPKPSNAPSRPTSSSEPAPRAARARSLRTGRGKTTTRSSFCAYRCSPARSRDQVLRQHGRRVAEVDEAVRDVVLRVLIHPGQGRHGGRDNGRNSLLGARSWKHQGPKPPSSLSDLVGREQFVEDGRRLGRVESGN
jgi:hypothetical protein